MSWFGGTSEFDIKVEAATSGAPEQDSDLPKVLEICDLIRSKEVPPKEAMRSIKRRISHTNPNVQLAALKLADTCVKNGGNHFLQEIASREFIDNIVSLLKSPGGVNRDVKEKMLEELQIWRMIFEGRPHLSYVSEAVKSLRSEGVVFPEPPAHFGSSFVDSSAPPEWADSDVCMRCRTPFSFTNRKHHCRNCGNVFDQQCSSHNITLPHLGIMQPVRVCDGCYAKRKEAGGNAGPMPSSRAASITSNTTKSLPRNARAHDEEEEEFQRALRLSLEESRRVNNHTISKPSPAPAATTTRKSNDDDQEDADLKAAIAASLKDAEDMRRVQANPNGSIPPPTEYKASPHELSTAESDNINLFATLIDRLESAPPGSILREPQIQELYDSISTLRPKLARSLGDAVGKYETLVDMHAKIQTVIRYYDRMLEDRLSHAYTRPSVSDYRRRPSYQQPAAPYQNPQLSGRSNVQETGYYHQPSSPQFSHPEVPVDTRVYAPGPPLQSASDQDFGSYYKVQSPSRVPTSPSMDMKVSSPNASQPAQYYQEQAYANPTPSTYSQPMRSTTAQHLPSHQPSTYNYRMDDGSQHARPPKPEEQSLIDL